MPIRQNSHVLPGVNSGRGGIQLALNYGDCFSYALAKWTGEPLLAKGNDFRLTDVAVLP